MKTFVLDSLLVLSRREKAGRALSFHQGKTVLSGPNGTGKSSLLKSIFWILGAEPAIISNEWRRANVEGLVRFSIDGRKYAIYRYSDTFGFFNDDALIGTFRSITNELGPVLAGLTDFGLVLPSHDGQATIPPPAYYFTPYYVDQDKGWSVQHGSFNNLNQFPNWRKPVLEYHAGVRTNEWYHINASLVELKSDLDEPTRERRTIVRMQEMIESQLETINVDLDMEALEIRTESLRDKIHVLCRKEQSYTSQVAALAQTEELLDGQISIVENAKREYSRDFDYSAFTLEDSVSCPTCGADYHNSFVERFAIAQDEEKCSELLTQLRLELRELIQRKDSLSKTLESVQSTISDVNRELDRIVDNVTLRDLMRIEGKRELRLATRRRMEELERIIDNLISRIGRLEQQRSEELKNTKKRAKKVKTLFNFHYANNLNKVGLFGNPLNMFALEHKIEETGSALPRSILAYTLAFYNLALAAESFAVPPLILDTPRQQDLDVRNWERIIALLNDAVPRHLQIVLAVTANAELFDAENVIRLDKVKSVLDQQAYGNVADQLRPFLNQMEFE